MSYAKANLYDIYWQALRASLLTKFVTEDGMKDNLEKLDAYRLKSVPGTYGRFIRLWRIINLLNGVRMGFHGMKLVDTPVDMMLLAFRSNMQKEYQNLKKAYSFKPVDWIKVENDVKSFKRANPVLYKEVFDNLSKRIDFAKLKTGTLSFRNELVRFVSLMQAHL